VRQAAVIAIHGGREALEVMRATILLWTLSTWLRDEWLFSAINLEWLIPVGLMSLTNIGLNNIHDECQNINGPKHTTTTNHSINPMTRQTYHAAPTHCVPSVFHPM
jgi:hypothetical protein